MPSQNSGIEYSVSVDAGGRPVERPAAAASAPRMPIHRPMTVDRIVEVPTSSIVGQSRSAMTVRDRLAGT